MMKSQLIKPLFAKIKSVVSKITGKHFKKKKKESNNYENDNSVISESSASDLNLMLKYGKANNKIGKYVSKKFIELPYGLVRKDLPNYHKQELLEESIELIMKAQFDDFDINKASGNEIVSFLLWIKEQIEFIKTVEENNLQSDPEPEMLAAGIHRLNEFGIATTVEKIAKDWNYTPEQVEQTPYFKIYEKMKMDKIQSEINKNYQKIMEEKSKRRR